MLDLLNEKNTDPVLRKWLLILIGRMWDDHEECYKLCERCNYIETVIEFAKTDPDPEVRAAAIYAIGTYIGCTPDSRIQEENGPFSASTSFTIMRLLSITRIFRFIL